MSSPVKAIMPTIERPKRRNSSGGTSGASGVEGSSGCCCSKGGGVSSSITLLGEAASSPLPLLSSWSLLAWTTSRRQIDNRAKHFSKHFIGLFALSPSLAVALARGSGHADDQGRGSGRDLIARPIKPLVGGAKWQSSCPRVNRVGFIFIPGTGSVCASSGHVGDEQRFPVGAWSSSDQNWATAS